MCGIAGINWSSESAVEKMNTAICHRGPDNAGIFTNEEVSLGHRRLAIIDLSPAGHMPMLGPDGLQLVFNGEIYNFQSVRAELESKGHVFQSHSDSEVLLKGYKEWGIDLLPRINGMFAFALYDPHAHSIFIARDRLGKKPLYYYYANGKFAFASELKAIEALDLPLTRDNSAIYDFFTYGCIPHTKTVYKEVKKLLPAHSLHLNLVDNTIDIQQYWDLADSLANEKLSTEKKRELDSLLEQCIADRLIADVPVANFLSGGLDSSTIAYYLQKMGRTDIEQIFISLPGRNGTDQQVEDLATTLQLPLHAFSINEFDYKNELQNIVAHFDEPIADNSAVPTYLIAQAAKAHKYTVVLSGDGGDELFAGYTRYNQMKQLTRLNKLRLQWLWKLLYAVACVTPFTFLEKILYLCSRTDEREQYIKIHGGFTRKEKKKIFTPEFLEEFKDYNDLWLFDMYWKPELSLVKRCQFMDVHTSLPDRLLVKSDRMTMAHSLELRSPFLDYRLFETVFSLAESEYTNEETTKALLRTLMAGKLPEYISQKNKEGFGYNVNSYIIEEPPKYIRETAGDFLLRMKKIFYLNSLNAIEQQYEKD